MASSSKLAELEDDFRGLKEQKAAFLASSELGPRDLIVLNEMNKDMDRVQDAITALSSGEVYYSSQLLPHYTLLGYSLVV